MNKKKEKVEWWIPIPKFLASAWKRGFFFDLVVLLAPNGAAAGFLPDPGLALGGWSLRRSQQCYLERLTIAPRSSSTGMYLYTRPSVKRFIAKKALRCFERYPRMDLVKAFYSSVAREKEKKEWTSESSRRVIRVVHLPSTAKLC